MAFFKLKKKKYYLKKKHWKIDRKCLDMIFESSKSIYPNEFGGLLRANDKKDTIIELVILPGTISGDSHTIFKMHMRPIDFSIVGTVHSHPSYSFKPSNSDKILFQKYGNIHIILAYPFNNKSWMAYDNLGNGIEIEII